MSDSKLLKNSIDVAAIKSIGKSIRSVYPEFDQARFVKQAKTRLLENELKQRVDQIIEALCVTLPSEFSKTSKILLDLAQFWEKNPSSRVAAFSAWPVIDFVAVVGKSHPKKALAVLEKLTPFFSAEFAIRPFYKEHQQLTLETATKWCSHRNEHVRRLASEGLRPRLPWASQLKEFISHPERILPILDQLNKDDSLYVRRSVANCMNDISKDHPDLVIQHCYGWLQQAQKLDARSKVHLDWVIRHATRSLVKQGKPEVFPLQGFTVKPNVTIQSLQLSADRVRMGETLKFDVALISNSDAQAFVMDYCVHFRKQNGSLAPKVFKLKNCTLNKNETMSIAKTLDFKPLSTRSYHAGEHHLAIHINGTPLARETFWLIT